jgi:hypothetical protein
MKNQLKYKLSESIKDGINYVATCVKPVADKKINSKYYLCNFCEGRNDQYMVYSIVWQEAGLELKDFCCLKCLQQKLSRPLSIVDFPPVDINIPIFVGAGLVLFTGE